jgi:hypothetical protein
MESVALVEAGGFDERSRTQPQAGVRVSGDAEALAYEACPPPVMNSAANRRGPA